MHSCVHTVLVTSLCATTNNFVCCVLLHFFVADIPRIHDTLFDALSWSTYTPILCVHEAYSGSLSFGLFTIAQDARIVMRRRSSSNALDPLPWVSFQTNSLSPPHTTRVSLQRSSLSHTHDLSLSHTHTLTSTHSLTLLQGADRGSTGDSKVSFLISFVWTIFFIFPFFQFFLDLAGGCRW